MQGYAPTRQLFFDANAVFDRPDDRRGVGQQKMDERQPRFGRGSERALGSSKELSQPQEQPRDRPALSRPAAERRLGDRALPPKRFGAVTPLDADAGGAASQTILHGFSRFRSATGRLPRRGQ